MYFYYQIQILFKFWIAEWQSFQMKWSLPGRHMSSLQKMVHDWVHSSHLWLVHSSWYSTILSSTYHSSWHTSFLTTAQTEYVQGLRWVCHSMSCLLVTFQAGFEKGPLLYVWQGTQSQFHTTPLLGHLESNQVSWSTMSENHVVLHIFKILNQDFSHPRCYLYYSSEDNTHSKTLFVWPSIPKT